MQQRKLVFVLLHKRSLFAKIQRPNYSKQAYYTTCYYRQTCVVDYRRFVVAVMTCRCFDRVHSTQCTFKTTNWSLPEFRVDDIESVRCTDTQ